MTALLPRRTFTEKDIAALVALAWSDNRPNPFGFLTDLRTVEKLLRETPGVVTIARGYVNVYLIETPEWRPECADRVERYLFDVLEDEAAERRLEELRQGTLPTEDEKACFEENYWEFDVIADTPAYYVDRLTTPASGDYEAERHAYFLSERHEMGQHSDLNAAAGPFRSLDEVAAALTNDPRSMFTAIRQLRRGVDVIWEAFADAGKEGKELEEAYRRAACTHVQDARPAAPPP
mgnify:CR=1 FL=1|jgi:hypothetical protein